MGVSAQKRIYGWMAFDWASQPFYTLGLTFIFGPYFAEVAQGVYAAQGMGPDAADAQAQQVWSAGQTVAGLIIALTAPFLGAFADSSGRKLPWIVGFSIVYVIACWSLWFLGPDGSNLLWMLVVFYVGFFAAESALNFVNAILPSLGRDEDVGKLSGSGMAVGYWGGVTALFIMLLLFAESDEGVTLIGIEPVLGLDPEMREGTRSVGPFIATWYLVFMIPFFLWVRDDPAHRAPMAGFGAVARELGTTIRSLTRRRSLGSFLLGSMLYRDALNALYAFGGVYAFLVLDWSTIQVGVFGIVGAVTAAVASFIGGRMDGRFGPKPVIKACILVLVVVCTFIIGMSRESLFGVPLAEGSAVPDVIFYVCGAAIGGSGGVLYSASRSMMVRHTHPERPAEAFGLFALAGKATAFLAPALIYVFTRASGSTQIGFVPLIFLFLAGLLLLGFTKPEGDRAEWSDSSPALS